MHRPPPRRRRAAPLPPPVFLQRFVARLGFREAAVEVAGLRRFLARARFQQNHPRGSGVANSRASVIPAELRRPRCTRRRRASSPPELFAHHQSQHFPCGKHHMRSQGQRVRHILFQMFRFRRAGQHRHSRPAVPARSQSATDSTTNSLSRRRVNPLSLSSWTIPSPPRRFRATITGPKEKSGSPPRRFSPLFAAWAARRGGLVFARDSPAFAPRPGR